MLTGLSSGKGLADHVRQVAESLVISSTGEDEAKQRRSSPVETNGQQTETQMVRHSVDVDSSSDNSDGTTIIGQVKNNQLEIEPTPNVLGLQRRDRT